MQNDCPHLTKLLKAYLDNTISQEEYQELCTLLNDKTLEQDIDNDLKMLWEESKEDSKPYPQEWGNKLITLINTTEKQQLNIAGTNNTSSIPRIGRFTRYAAAAIIIMATGLGFYFALPQTDKSAVKANNEFIQQDDIRPGRDNAILTLADGSQINLDNVTNGNITSQGNTKVIKLDGLINYQVEGSIPAEVTYNTITTPRGGQYQLVLADGSKVWLNASSSLRFPTAFAGKDRNVELTGEGYFEIAHDAAKPFHVSVKGMEVEVLGTHFNINAYADEPSIKTTLLEGKVKITNTGTTVILKPGQQAQVNSENKLAVIDNVDQEEAVAWKNGKFFFNGSNIYAVMRQLSRWYDVDVAYEGKISDDEFIGIVSVPRNENISFILKKLKATKTVDFNVTAKKIIVLPYQR